MLPETCQHHPMQWLGEGIILGPILMLSGNSDIYGIYFPVFVLLQQILFQSIFCNGQNSGSSKAIQVHCCRFARDYLTKLQIDLHFVEVGSCYKIEIYHMWLPTIR